MRKDLLPKLICLVLVLLVMLVVSLMVGASGTIGLGEVFEQLARERSVVSLFRMPRTLAAVLVGICFALSGSLLQALTRNPLASPDLIGVTSGGALTTILAILVAGPAAAPHLPWIAFLGSAAMAWLVWMLGRDVSRQRFVLTGVALTAISQAAITLLLVTYAPSAAEAMIWLKGSLFGRGWEHVNHILPWAIVATLGGMVAAHSCNPLLLGDSVATSLGVRVILLRRWLWFLSVVAAAGAVAVAGTIGFVGLLVPHAARKMAGPDLRSSLPVAMILGAIMVVLADTLGRVISPPLEIPAGLICAFIGAPYFAILLWKGKTAI